MPQAPLAWGFPNAENGSLGTRKEGLQTYYKSLLHWTRSSTGAGLAHSTHLGWMVFWPTPETRASCWVTKWARLLLPGPAPTAPLLRPLRLLREKRSSSLLLACVPTSVAACRLYHISNFYLESLLVQVRV